MQAGALMPYGSLRWAGKRWQKGRTKCFAAGELLWYAAATEESGTRRLFASRFSLKKTFENDPLVRDFRDPLTIL